MRRGWPAVFVVALVVVCALSWPLPLRLGQADAPSAFFGGHAWVADHLFQVAFGDHHHTPTSDAGYPWVRDARYINWGPTLLSWPLRAMLSPLGAYQLVHLLSIPLTALAAWPLLRRWTDADRATCAAACLVWGLSPFLLSTLAIGETPKLNAWGLPLFLWALDRLIGGSLRHGLVLIGIVVATSLTSPYYGLSLPLLAAGLCGVRLMTGAGWGPRLRAAAGLGLTAGALLPAFFYFSQPFAPVPARVFRPAAAGETGANLPWPHPVATPADLLWAPTLGPRDPYDVIHVAYLGLPLLLAVAGLLLWRRARGWQAGLLLLLGGILLAMGPHLAVGEHFTRFPLPANALVRLGYPYVRGGMWFRLTVIAGLGLAVMLAASTAPLKRGAWVAWGLALLQLGDAVRASGPWPLELRALPAARVLAGARPPLRQTDGAVLHLPLDTQSKATSPQSMVTAAVHGRPSNGLPRDTLQLEVSALRRLVIQALESPDPAEALRALGFRWVVFQPIPGVHARIRRELLIGKLGPPQGAPGFEAWDLGPTALAPRTDLLGPVR
ncbi:MAG: hypothetical protein H6739_33955 [Alphaproteobacteria bacterium]|nr:hypothetical protein [Alphaproteobacteria bacterium]